MGPRVSTKGSGHAGDLHGGRDLAKNVFQPRGAGASERTVFRQKPRRDQVLACFGQLRQGVVAMEACGGANFRGRKIGRLCHDVRPIPPDYVKPFVKRQKDLEG